MFNFDENGSLLEDFGAETLEKVLGEVYSLPVLAFSFSDLPDGAPIRVSEALAVKAVATRVELYLGDL